MNMLKYGVSPLVAIALIAVLSAPVVAEDRASSNQHQHSQDLSEAGRASLNWKVVVSEPATEAVRPLPVPLPAAQVLFLQEEAGSYLSEEASRAPLIFNE